MCESGIIESQRDQIYRIDEARKRVEERIGSKSGGKNEIGRGGES